MKRKKALIKKMHEEARLNWYKSMDELKHLAPMNLNDDNFDQRKFNEGYEKVLKAEARFLALDEVVTILGL